jgi:hypothetical protein
LAVKDLFFSELRRFRTLSLTLALAHLLLLLFLNRMNDFLQQPYFDSVILFGVYTVLGLALALVQVGSYRKPSQWLWLIHRPLSTERIFAALGLSSLTLLTITMFMPMLLLVLGTDLFTSKVVDSRHYMSLVHLLAFAMMAWLGGAHACVSRSKAAIAVLCVPILTMHLVSVWWLLLPVAISLAWLSWITLKSFRANRDAPLPSNSALLLTALPLQLGLFLLLAVIGKMAFLTVSIMLGTDPLNTEFPPQGGLIETVRAEPKQEMIWGLAHSADARATSWREQLPLMEPVRIGPYVARFPIRHQLSNLNAPTQWWDEKRRIMWTFSHDRMLFHGRAPESGADHGWWGVNGAGDTTPFAEVPFASGTGYLLSPSALYAIDNDEQRQHELFRLQAGEAFVDIPQREFNRLMVLTNQRLLAYRTDRQNVSPFAPLLLDWQVQLPRGVTHLEGVSIAEMMDGWLLSFLYGDGLRQIGFTQFSNIVQPWQQMLFVDDEARAVVVGEREINRDYPALYQTVWWLSPLLHTLSEWPESALDKGLTWPLQPELLPDVPEFYPAAAALMLASLALALWWLRGTGMSPARRRLWLASCAALGLPAFLSMILLEPRALRS